jgi:hypothetical protein
VSFPETYAAPRVLLDHRQFIGVEQFSQGGDMDLEAPVIASPAHRPDDLGSPQSLSEAIPVSTRGRESLHTPRIAIARCEETDALNGRFRIFGIVGFNPHGDPALFSPRRGFANSLQEF